MFNSIRIPMPMVIVMFMLMLPVIGTHTDNIISRLIVIIISRPNNNIPAAIPIHIDYDIGFYF